MPGVLLIRHCASSGPEVDPTFGFAGWRSLTTPDVYAIDGPPDGPWTSRRVWTAGG